jgi:hypothetical protein
MAIPFKRKIFYLPGFDPRGPRFYHQLYKAQAERYSARSGEAVAVSGRSRGPGPAVSWHVSNSTTGVETDYSCLEWDDIIRRGWISNPASLLARSAATYWNYTRKLDFGRLLRMPRGPLVTLFYPPLSTLLIPVAIFLVVLGLGSLVTRPAWAALAAAIVALGVGIWVLNRMKSFWLLRFFIFNNDLTYGREDPELDARLDAFAQVIADSFDGDADEILLVTHSNGSILALPLMERLAAIVAGRFPDRFTLLTLGHCIPLLGCHVEAHRFHAQLKAVGTLDFDWVDIGFPPDGAAYTKVDPFCGVVPDSRPRVKHLSAQIFRFWPPAEYARRRKNKYELHFDYLRCGETLSPIDHVSMTAGRRTIDEAVAAFEAIK